MGRPPLDNPKSIKLTIRVTAEEAKILDDYCERNGMTRAEGVRKALYNLQFFKK